MTLEARPLDPLLDHFGLIELFETVFGHTVTPAMWYWKYVPPWTARHYCYVGRVDGRVIGYFGAVPLRGVIDGEEVMFFQLADFMVHPEYRLQYDYFGIGREHILADIRAVHRRHLVYGFSGHKAFRYFERRKIAAMIERAKMRVLRAADAGQQPRFEFVDWRWDAPAIDAAWQRHRAAVGTGLVRDAQYLKWRYASHPVNNYRLLGVREGGVDQGFLVIGNDRPGVRNRAKEIPVVDALLPAGSAIPVAQALAGFLGNDTMVWQPNRIAPGATEERDSGTHVYHFLENSAADTGFLRDHLYYTMGDVDWW